MKCELLNAKHVKGRNNLVMRQITSKYYFKKLAKGDYKDKYTSPLGAIKIFIDALQYDTLCNVYRCTTVRCIMLSISMNYNTIHYVMYIDAPRYDTLCYCF